MERYVVRFIKPVALAVITFISVYFLSGSAFIGLVIASIPLLLGWLGIMETFAYGMAATVFIAAVLWAAAPSEVKTFVEAQATSLSNDLREQAARGKASP